MEFEVLGYREDALKVYEEKCEFVGCGWNVASCDAHHIDYQEHRMVENGLREAYDMGYQNMIDSYEARRQEYGYPAYNLKTRQLPKNDDTRNISFLCPNHHRYVHTVDMGMDLLNYIPPRKALVK